MLTILLILGLVGVLSLKSPNVAVFLLTAFISFWIEWSFPVFFDTKIGVVDVAVVGGLFVAILYSYNGRNDQKIPLKGLILSYMIISILAYFANHLSEVNGFLKHIWGAYKTIYVTSTFFLFYIVLNNAKVIQKTVNLVLFSSLFCSLIGIIQGITQTPIGFKIGTYGESIIFSQHFPGALRAFGTFTHSNEFAAFLIWPLSISLTLFFMDTGYKFRKYLPLFILIQSCALLLTFSRAGWMGFLLSFIIIGYYLRIYKRLSFLIIVLLFPLMGILLHGMFPEINLIPGDFKARLSSINNKNDPAMMPRYDRWEYFYKRSLDKPFVGHGVVSDKATFEYFDDYAVSPHNVYLSTAVKRGFLALGIIMLIVIKIAVRAKNVYELSEDIFLKALGLGIFAGLIGIFGIAGWFDSILEERQINILFWYLLAVTLRSEDIEKQRVHKKVII